MTPDCFYHYTGRQQLRDIFAQDTNHTSYGENGLIPMKRFIPIGQASSKQLPEKAFSGSVFGLLSPLPLGWLTHSWKSPKQCVFEDVIESIVRDGQLTLLKVHTLPDDDIHVADWGVHLHPEFNGTAASPIEIVHQTKKNYWDSLVPITNHAGYAHHVIPEVICFSRIPPERIEIVGHISIEEIKERIAQAKPR